MNAQQGVVALRHARRMWQDETRVGTYIAVLLVAIFVGWPAYSFWKSHR
jgi:hypothetical protein